MRCIQAIGVGCCLSRVEENGSDEKLDGGSVSAAQRRSVLTDLQLGSFTVRTPTARVSASHMPSHADSTFFCVTVEVCLTGTEFTQKR